MCQVKVFAKQTMEYKSGLSEKSSNNVIHETVFTLVCRVQHQELA